ncbi:MAG: aerobic-type carbon monoxide dehydrogenase, large subunit CoxL/CutL-like protein [Myxococcaceae bacterium]|nr:aerobic-type carbon monoxide dehydrogenase, large subunit CoxL/CutL-like protein [Myxococcaceae bacterium]
MRTRRTLNRGPGHASVVVEADDDATLLEIARNELGVRSASRACTDGTCGACRLLIDDEIVASCRRTWDSVPDGARVEAYEDVAVDAAAEAAVTKFEAERPTRCRMCVGALGVTAVALARRGRSGDTEAIALTLETATCMCTGRGSWRRALATSR